MIIVTLWGGLGNQMFQYSAGFALAQKTKSLLMMDISHLRGPARQRASLAGATPRSFELDAFHISGEVADDWDVRRYYVSPEGSLAERLRARLHRSLSRTLYYRPPPFAYEDRFASLTAPVLAMGSFQHYRYSEPVLENLKHEFRAKSINPTAAQVIERIRNEESIGIHVRRGDYVENPLYGVIGAQEPQYYLRALKIALEHAGKAATVYVFSDDVDWTRNNLDIRGNITYVSDPANAFTSHDEFEIMKRCHHLVVSNSSFSWWAARLKDRADGLVIAPRIWVREPQRMSTEFCPPSWLTI